MSSEPPSTVPPPTTPAPAPSAVPPPPPPRPIFNANGQPMPPLVNLDPTAEATRPRTAQEAERFFRRVALEGQPPSKTMRWLSIGGWVAGAFAAGYMVLYADFGEREHVFSPIRRQFNTYTSSIAHLSEEEKARLGITASSRSIFENPQRRESRTARESLESEGEKGQPR